MPAPSRTREDNNRSPERTKLAEAISRHREAQSRLGQLRQARERAQQASFAATGEIDAAEGLLAEAKSGAPRAYVERLLNGGEAGGTDLVDAAQRRLAQARRQGELADEAMAILDDEIRRGETALSIAGQDLKAATGEVLQLEAGHVLSRYREAKRGVATWLEIVRAIDNAGGISKPDRDPNWFVFPPPGMAGPAPDEATVAAWRDALTALAADPDAKLPSDDAAAAQLPAAA